MNFADYMRMAWKNLTRQKSRTFLTIVAITVGSLSVILMASLIIGVRQSLLTQLKKMGAFQLVTVTRDPNSSDNPQLISAGNSGPTDEDGKKIDDTTVQDILALPYVADATPTLSVWVKTIRLEGQDKKMWSNMMAYRPDANVFDMPLLSGRILTDGDMDKIVVGWRFAQTAGFASNPQSLIGKRVILSYDTGPGNAPDWGPTPAMPPENAGEEWWKTVRNTDITAEIVGVADNRNMDENQNYVTIAWARKLMTQVNWKYDDTAKQTCEKDQQILERQRQQSKENKMENQPDVAPPPSCAYSRMMTLTKDDSFDKSGYGSVIVKVRDTTHIKNVAEYIRNMGYGVTTAQNMLDQINRVFGLVSLVLGVIGGISLFVAAIGIINTMLMATYERIREIGVFRACGATQSTIMGLFAFEAALLGFIGGVFGLLCSVILSQTAGILVRKYGASLGDIPLENIGNYPIWLIAAVILFTTLIGLVSGLYPAIRASKLNPVEALRYE